MDRRAQTDITLHGDPTGEFGRRLVYQGLKKALETGTFLHGGLLTGNSERWLKGGSGNWESLYGHSVKGIWRGGFFTGDPGRGLRIE
jgi:hypothetical protein